MPDRRSNRPLVFLALAAALAVAGCNKPVETANDAAAANGSAPLPSLPATLPMTTGAATAAAYAPPVSALPAARPVRAVRVAHSGDAYAYADDAYAFSNAVGNAPPDYGFDYEGTEPWAWQGYDQSRTFVEPVADGYRYYYYRPGAATPYFVRDPDYGYGYDDGSLAVIYGAGGAILPYAEYGPRLDYAARYLQRGQALFEASRGNERRAVNAANWAARQGAIAASRDRWAAAEARQAGWQAYRARVSDQQAQHWAQEAARRDADAQRFATWHDDGFRSAPPPRAIPAAWQQAPWAQDQQRYRVADRRPTPPLPAFQRPADPGRSAFAPHDAAPRNGVPTQAQQPRFADGRDLGPRGQIADQRAAAAIARHQDDAARIQQQEAARAGEQQQRRATVDARRRDGEQQPPVAGEQQQAVRQQQSQAARQAQQAQQAQQAEREQRSAADRQQRDAARQADRAQQSAVRVHRGDGAPMSVGMPQRDPQRQQQQLPRSQPQRDDQRQDDRQQRQAMHQEQQAARQQQVPAHQQAAPAPHMAPQPQHAPAPPHVAPAPRPAPAPHQAAAPHPQGGEHGEHR